MLTFWTVCRVVGLTGWSKPADTGAGARAGGAALGKSEDGWISKFAYKRERNCNLLIQFGNKFFSVHTTSVELQVEML